MLPVPSHSRRDREGKILQHHPSQVGPAFERASGLDAFGGQSPPAPLAGFGHLLIQPARERSSPGTSTNPFPRRLDYQKRPLGLQWSMRRDVAVRVTL